MGSRIADVSNDNRKPQRASGNVKEDEMEEDIDWARVLRLQEQYAAARDPLTREALDDAISREVDAIGRGMPRTGTTDTAMANYRRRERNRHSLEALVVPLYPTANDPWPELHRRLALARAVCALKPATQTALEYIYRGYTYEEAGAELNEPVGTLKSRVSRARIAMTA